jgi:hypothetical protein
VISVDVVLLLHHHIRVIILILSCLSCFSHSVDTEIKNDLAMKVIGQELFILFTKIFFQQPLKPFAKIFYIHIFFKVCAKLSNPLWRFFTVCWKKVEFDFVVKSFSCRALVTLLIDLYKQTNKQKSNFQKKKFFFKKKNYLDTTI